MTDIHSHILPTLDDGAETLADAVEMARIAADAGIGILTATPHSNVPEEFDNPLSAALLEAFRTVQRAVKEQDIPLRLALGMEVFATDEVPALLRAGKLLTLNGSRYLLIEFAFDEDPEWIGPLLARLTGMGLTPVIAHPERYPFLFDRPDYLYRWICSGCLSQVNGASLLGRFGPHPQALSMLFVRHNLVHAVASDAHGPVHRPPDLREVHALLAKQFSAAYADYLLDTAPRAMLQNRVVQTIRPERPACGVQP